MISVTAMGEVLIDFTDVGTSETGQKLFERNPGGAPANVLVALQQLGFETAFIGKVGTDMHGEFLRDTLTANGIDCSGLISDPPALQRLPLSHLMSVVTAPSPSRASLVPTRSSPAMR